MAPLLSNLTIPACVGTQPLEITVRKTFLHVAFEEIEDIDAKQEWQPEVKRATTTPVMWLSEESAEDDEDGSEHGLGNEDWRADGSSDCSPQPCVMRITTHDPFEASIVRTESLLRRVNTHDPFDSPANFTQLDLDQPRRPGPVDLSTRRRRPSLRSIKTFDTFESPVRLSSEAAQLLHSAESVAQVEALASSEQVLVASAGCAPSVFRIEDGAVMPSGLNPEASGNSSVAQQKLAGPAWRKMPLPNSPSRTTIMLRNLPNNYTQDMLLDLIDWAGFAGKYDFLYLPMDFQTHAALGYAFVNLVSHEDAEQMREFFNGFASWLLPTNKVCSAAWSHPHQGLEAHIARYRNSPLMHEDVPDSYRPILFVDGARAPFPPPTKRVKPPRKGTERMLV